MSWVPEWPACGIAVCTHDIIAALASKDIVRVVQTVPYKNIEIMVRQRQNTFQRAHEWVHAQAHEPEHESVAASAPTGSQ